MLKRIKWILKGKPMARYKGFNCGCCGKWHNKPFSIPTYLSCGEWWDTWGICPTIEECTIHYNRVHT